VADRPTEDDLHQEAVCNGELEGMEHLEPSVCSTAAHRMSS